MTERTTLEVIAPTVEEALTQGLAQLGLTAADVSVEVLDSGSKGLFGLGGRQVRVLLTVNPPPGSVKAESTPASKPERKQAPTQRAESKPKASPPTHAKAEKREPQKPMVRQQKESPKPAPAKREEPKVLKPAVHDALLDTTEALISKLIHLMGMQAQISAHYGDDDREDRRSIEVDIRGDDLSALIGRHAETLNAFQHVASLMVGKEGGQWVQLTVDVEGYRSRRGKQLETLANRMAEQVIKTGRRATLEPMPSEERRAIHIALRGHPAVTTESTGEDPHRKVVILLKK